MLFIFIVPSILSLEAKALNISSIIIFWNVSGICDNYTISTTQLCTNEVLPPMSGINGTLSSIVITGLSSGYEYSVNVTPVNILGEGMAMTETVITPGTSNVKTIDRLIFIICDYYLDPPSGAPVLLVPVIINSTAISLSWGEVNCTERNGAITGYSVQYSIVGGMQSIIIVNVTGDVTSIVIGGLTEFTIYTFSVAAINNIGVGNYSDRFIGIMHAGTL